MDKEYRIREYMGRFSIERKIKKYTGILFWRSIKFEWSSDYLPVFKTLKAAKEWLRLEKKAPIYHYPKKS